MFENVDGRVDAGVIGILIAHLGAFGSGELKWRNKVTNLIENDEKAQYQNFIERNKKNSSICKIFQEVGA